MPVEQWSDDVLLVELGDDPSCTDDLNGLVDQLGEDKASHVVFDFSNVTYLNSSNIAKLLKLRKVVAISHQKRMVLCAINSHVWGVFLITGLERLFDFADSVAEGLAATQIEG